MITYTKEWWGIGALTQMYGSALPRTAPIAAASTGLAAIVHFFWHDHISDEFKNPYPFQAFAFVVGFLLVFRCASQCTCAPLSAASVPYNTDRLGSAKGLTHGYDAALSWRRCAVHGVDRSPRRSAALIAACHASAASCALLSLQPTVGCCRFLKNVFL
jgi:hypothetical protein